MNRLTKACGGLLAAVVLATAGPAAANHYPDVPKSVWRKDRNVLEGLSRLLLVDTTYITLEPDSCDCLELSCDEGHILLGCGGEIDLYAGVLSAARRTAHDTCLVCGCAGDSGADLRATPVCAGF